MNERQRTFFRTSITDEAILNIGKFHLAWGELDFVIMLVAKHISGLSYSETEAQIGSETTRGKVNFVLESGGKNLPEKLKRRFNRLASKRNALSHGVWVEVHHDSDLRPVCYHPGDLNTYVFVEDLSELTSEVSFLARELAESWLKEANIAFDGTSEGPLIAIGYGSPEGKVEASVGSVYLDISDGNRKLPFGPKV